MVVDEVIQGRRLTPAELAEIRNCSPTIRIGIGTRISQRALPALGLAHRHASVPKIWPAAARSQVGGSWLDSAAFASTSQRQRSTQPATGPDRADCSVLEADSGEPEPVRIDPVAPGSREDALRAPLQRHHYLGFRNRVGENIGYLVCPGPGALAARFRLAAWHCQAARRLHRLNEEQRHRHRWRLTNNTRFLIPAWVRVPHLASHVLARVLGRLTGLAPTLRTRRDLVETFVDPALPAPRTAAAAAVGANHRQWGRNGPSDTASTTAKEVFVRPLGLHWRQRLCP
ncbi:MAG: DUF4338 domain-containing protein [Verrucomicrobiae bacterium]|nr:DUF4338 domain-containing protein [Verrucomicrobiae bacterium]